MKKVIDGTLYNTESAKEIGSRSNGRSLRDFNYVYERLMKNKAGKYFLHGEGGANTCYAERVDSNCWTGGELITPMSRDEAFEWAQEYLDGDEVMAEFELPDEDRVYIGAYIDESTKAKLDELKSSTNKSLSELVRYALESAYK